MKHKFHLTGAVWLALVTGCLALFAQSPANVDSTHDRNLGQYSDPVAYCQAVGTIDKPDSRYVGPKLPVWMADDLNLQPEQSSAMEWRCADGAVMACVYGANIPCDSKANTSETPSSAITGYCKQNRNRSYVPKYVTGHDSAVSWACKGERPVVIGVDSIDSQGYTAFYWRKVQP